MIPRHLARPDLPALTDEELDALSKLYASEEPTAQFFKFGHLPERLQIVSAPFALLAASIVIGLPKNPERSVALRKLLEGKDAAVRAFLFVAV